MILLIKQYRGSKNKTLHYFGAYTKIVEHIISKEQINTSLNNSKNTIVYDFVDVNKIVLIVLNKLIVRKSTHQI